MKTAVPVGAAMPRRGNVLTQLLGHLMLRFLGFRIEGEIPSEPRMIAAVAPHTSNWDFLVGIATVFALRLDAAFLGKDAIFRWPFSYLFRYLGGIPVDRRDSHGVVPQMVDTFRSRPTLFLGIAPSGTRRSGATWKMGFYHIAVGADVPVLPVALDYGRGALVLGPLHRMTGDQDAEVRRLQDFFEGVPGKRGTGPFGLPQEPGSAEAGSTGTGKR